MSEQFYTVRFKITDEYRPLTFIAPNKEEAYQYYDMIRERTGVEYATLFSPSGEVQTYWRLQG